MLLAAAPHPGFLLLAEAACALVLLAASVCDLMGRIIPNRLVLALALAGLAARVASQQLLAGLTAGGVVFLVAAFCWRRGWMGGGDVKLLAAAAIAVPAGQVWHFIAAVGLAGGVLAALYLLARRFAPPPSRQRPQAWLARRLRAECWRIHRGTPLPYACAIAAGALIILS